MRKIAKITVIFMIFFCLQNCGKKGGIEYPGGQKMPKFDKVFDE